jgi:hypothetical protein
VATDGMVGGVGQLPAPIATDSEGRPLPATSTTSSTLPASGTVGDEVTGNRVLLIGDSILASTSRRYSNDTCRALVPNGWQAEVEAESGQFIEFGDTVLDARLSAGWDAAVIFLGNNYNGDQASYARQLGEMVQRLAPRPVMLLTVTEFRPDRAEVNDAIRFIADNEPNVRIVDWAARTAGPDAERILGGDGLHLSTYGREQLANEIAWGMGIAPVRPGDCLKSTFIDDTRGPNVDGSKRPTTTTVRPGTATTVNGGQSTTTVGGTPTVPTTPQVTQPSTTASVPSTAAATTSPTTAP